MQSILLDTTGSYQDQSNDIDNKGTGEDVGDELN